MVPRGTKNEKDQYINRVNHGKGRAAVINGAMYEHLTTFPLQFAGAMDGLSTCTHGYAIPGVANSCRILDVPSLVQRMARRNKKTGVVTLYNQNDLFKEILSHDFEIIKDPRDHGTHTIRAGEELVLRHRDLTAFHPHDNESINRVKFALNIKVDDDKKLRGKGAKGFNDFAMPSVFTTAKDFRVSNVTDADRKIVIDQMMTLNEDDLKLFLKKQMNSDVVKYFCSKLGYAQRNRDGTMRTTAKRMELIVVAIKKRKEDEGNLKPASK